MADYSQIPDQDEQGALAKRERERLQALSDFQILDTPAEPKFERIVQMAGRLFGTPIALVSLVDESRQWFKARVGIEAEETPLSISFCAHAIRRDEVLVVEDATQDSRFAENPLVVGDPKIRFYAGAPLRTSDGYNLGTLCVIDQTPRSLTPEQTKLLEDLAALVVDEMELRRANANLARLARTDAMTGLWNRRHFFELAENERKRSLRHGHPISIIALDIDRFKSVNDRHGHDAGDQVISDVARLCQAQKRASDIAARFGGEEFVILMPDTDLCGAEEFATRLGTLIRCTKMTHPHFDINVTVSIGVSEFDPAVPISVALKAADAALYRAKELGRDRVCTAPRSTGSGTRNPDAGSKPAQLAD